MASRPEDTPISSSLADLDAALRQACAERPELRSLLGCLASWLQEIADAPPGQTPHARPSPADEPAPSETPAHEEEVPTEELPLRLGDAEVFVSARVHDRDAARRARELADAPPEQEPIFEAEEAPAPRPRPDLSLVARRCRLKADACRWVIRRRRLVAEEADFQTEIRPTDHTFRQRCEPLSDCVLWMLSPYRALPDDDTLETVAQCYEALADAAELARSVRDALDHTPDDSHDDLEDSYALLAEAQSMLRRALADSVEDYEDADQFDAFTWLKQRTDEDRIYIERHMRLKDPADPGRVADLAERINALSEAFENRRREEKRRASLLNKVRYHARRVREDTPTPHDWNTLAGAVRDLVSERLLRPSNIELREILLPIVDDLPDDLDTPSEMDLVLREIDRYLASREQADPAGEEPHRKPSAELREAVELLRGCVVVLLGGEFRPQRKHAIERELELAELRWVELPDHVSLDRLEPEIARSDVRLVLLLKRWCSHMHEDIRALCDRHDKIFVRMPAGYSPNQIAHQVLRQASDRLRTTA